MDHWPVIELDEQSLLNLPIDRLGLLLLEDFSKTAGHGESAHILTTGGRDGYPILVQGALAEAFGWLRARGLTALDPNQSIADSIFITRLGRQALDEGPTILYAVERLQGGLHPVIEEKARTQFLIGEYEQAVFASMKAIEVRVRALGGFGNEDTGVALMNRAFGNGGPLVDPHSNNGEQEGTRALFAGAYAVLRNPAGHRDIDYDDIGEAAEAVHTASMLMRMLDRVEARAADRTK